MIKFLLTLAIVGLFVYVGATVKLGSRTFFGHVRAIWHTEEVQELKDGVKQTAGPAVDRVERGVKAGYHAIKDGSDAGIDATAKAP